jgi:hypothetical protein
MPLGQISQAAVGFGSNQFFFVRVADQAMQLYLMDASLVFFAPSSLSFGKPFSK